MMEERDTDPGRMLRDLPPRLRRMHLWVVNLLKISISDFAKNKYSSALKKTQNPISEFQYGIGLACFFNYFK